MSKPLQIELQLEKDVDNYLNTHESYEIKQGEFTAIVQAPVEVTPGMYIDDLPDPSKLPRLPERMRDFAFSYATNRRSQAYWAKQYGVSHGAITKWLADARVQYYISVTRYERRMYLMGAVLQLERKMYTTLNKILATKINGYTVQSVLEAVKFTWKVINAPESLRGGDAKAFNMHIGFDQASTMRDVTPPPFSVKEPNTMHHTPEKIKVLEDRVAYAKRMRDDLVNEAKKRSEAK